MKSDHNICSSVQGLERLGGSSSPNWMLGSNYLVTPSPVFNLPILININFK